MSEKKLPREKIVLIAVMVALTVVSRLLFAPIPSFKPVTSIVIIAGIAFGARAGYITGAMLQLFRTYFLGKVHGLLFKCWFGGLSDFLSGVFFTGKLSNFGLL